MDIHMQTTTSKNTHFRYLLTALLIPILTLIGSANAAQKYSPNDVYAGVEYANRLIDRILTANGINEINIPVSREAGAKPMHVYELHVSALAELYAYALEEERRPPPLAVSTPITYTPTDVYYLTQLVINNLEEVYRDSGGVHRLFDE